MWQARIVLVSMCCICTAGCPHQKPATPSASQTPPPIASGILATPQSLAQSQVETIVDDKLSILTDAITWKRCTNNLPATTGTPAASIAAAFNGDSQVNHAAWLQYIADHIASGTTLGSHYGKVADNVFVGLTPLSPTGDVCNALNLKDTQQSTIWEKTTPYSIGESLFETFAPYDQGTHQLAAKYLLSIKEPW